MANELSEKAYKNLGELFKKLGTVSVKDLDKEDFDAEAISTTINDLMVKNSPKLKEQYNAGEYSGVEKAEKKIAKKLGLKAEDYKELKEGRLDKMLEDGLAALKAEKGEGDDDDDDGKSGSKGKLSSEAEKAYKDKIAKLEETAAAFKELGKENKLLKEKVEAFPQREEEIKNQISSTFKRQATFANVVAKMLPGIKPELHRYHTPELLEAQGYGIEIEPDGSYRLARKEADGSLKTAWKSKTEPFTDLGELLMADKKLTEADKSSGANPAPPANPQNNPPANNNNPAGGQNQYTGHVMEGWGKTT